MPWASIPSLEEKSVLCQDLAQSLSSAHGEENKLPKASFTERREDDAETRELNRQFSGRVVQCTVEAGLYWVSYKSKGAAFLPVGVIQPAKGPAYSFRPVCHRDAESHLC